MTLQKFLRHIKTTFCLLCIGSTFIVSLLLLSGCGKNEGHGGTVGAVSGALVGASLANKRDQATGALIGGLVGNLVGSAIGRNADDEEAAYENKIRERHHARRLAQIEQENENLRQSLRKWCFDCRRKSNVIGAYSCTSCGGTLMTELHCHRCSRTYEPTSGFYCCPFCQGGVKLAPR